MKLAVYSESAADEAAIRILVEGVVGRPSVPIALNQFGTRRGWTSVLRVFPTVLKHLHYGTDAEALVTVLDSDRSPIHVPAHEQAEGEDKNCRLCILSRQARQTLRQLRPVPGRVALRVGIGLAVPCIEAWLLCGRDAHVTEAAWMQGLLSKRLPYDSKALKRKLYGTDRPSLEAETRRMTEEARRLAQAISQLDKWFPNGFGPLYRDVKTW